MNRKEYQKEYFKKNKVKLRAYKALWIKTKRLLNDDFRIKDNERNKEISRQSRLKKNLLLNPNYVSRNKKYEDDLSDLIPIK